MPDGESQRVVLVADDDELLREALEELLAEADYSVVTARDGADAFDRIMASRPDVILLDMMMPDVDGIAVLERMGKECPTPRPPVIAYSGFEDFKDLALSRGAAAFLQKPFESRCLLETVAAQFLPRAPAPSTIRDATAIEHAERMREEILHAAKLDDEVLRTDLRRLVNWAAAYFGTEKSFVVVLHCEHLYILAQSGPSICRKTFRSTHRSPTVRRCCEPHLLFAFAIPRSIRRFGIIRWWRQVCVFTRGPHLSRTSKRPWVRSAFAIRIPSIFTPRIWPFSVPLAA